MELVKGWHDRRDCTAHQGDRGGERSLTLSWNHHPLAWQQGMAGGGRGQGDGQGMAGDGRRMDRGMDRGTDTGMDRGWQGTGDGTRMSGGCQGDGDGTRMARNGREWQGDGMGWQPGDTAGARPLTLVGLGCVEQRQRALAARGRLRLRALLAR